MEPLIELDYQVRRRRATRLYFIMSFLIFLEGKAIFFEGKTIFLDLCATAMESSNKRRLSEAEENTVSKLKRAVQDSDASISCSCFEDVDDAYESVFVTAVEGVSGGRFQKGVLRTHERSPVERTFVFQEVIKLSF